MKSILIAILISSTPCVSANDDDTLFVQEELKHQYFENQWQHQQDLTNEYNQQEHQRQWQQTVINQQRMQYPNLVIAPPPAIIRPW